MIKKWLVASSVVISGLLTSVSAQAAGNIAFVEVSRILQSAPQVETIKEKIKKEFGPRDNEMVAQQKQIQKLQEKLVRDGAIMSDEEAKRLEKDILTRSRKLKTSKGEFQEDLALRQNEELNKLRKVIAEVIVEIAKKDGYDIVLEGGVVWAKDEINITDKVLKKLKK